MASLLFLSQKDTQLVITDGPQCDVITAWNLQMVWTLAQECLEIKLLFHHLLCPFVNFILEHVIVQCRGMRCDCALVATKVHLPKQVKPDKILPN